MADTEHDMREAGLFEQAQLVGEERLARDLDEQLGDFLRDGPEPGGEAAREDGDGEVWVWGFQKAT
ncbi:hypothetical protein [Opitutus sp. GAS368]|uniref:hypothetical protein n=1 Tax=Opitutus sp. GAS368 TaxID=1882749 RepID=UPI001E486D57|nr:hypothetical protein [Opitutus sp. GAS368]